MTIKRARLYDVIALCVALVVVVLDQWTKALVVAHLSPPGSKDPIALIGQYLLIDYFQNKGAAFSMFFSDSAVLAVLIFVAIAVVVYLYIRMLNRGPFIYKIVFGLIIGGAVSNLIDRARHGGYVVDFISFRIPQWNFYFAIFNIADACISVGVFLLFVLILLGSFSRSTEVQQQGQSTTASGGLRPTEQDAQR